MENNHSAQYKKTKSWAKYSARQVIAILATILVMGSSAATATAASAPAMTTVIDGDTTHTVWMNGAETKEILELAGITVGDQDRIIREEKDGVTITVKRATETPIQADGKTVNVACYTGDSIASVLEQAGVVLGENDVVNLGLDDIVLQNMVIQVTRQYNVYVVDNGIAKGYVIPEGTVSQSMATTNFALQGEDYFANGDAPVSENLIIGVNHVTYQEVQTTEEIPYSVVNKDSDTLYKGSTQVENPGMNGSKSVTSRQKLVNGEVVSSEVVKEEVLVEPVDQVVLQGTKAKPSSVATSISVTPQGTLVDSNGNAIRYSRKIVGSCTAYTGGGITSTGKAAAVGRVAVNPNVIPYGTKLYICSPDGKVVYGYAIASDTGGALMSGRVLCDLYMNSYSECVNFGRRQMAVYVLD
ncbi:MAG: DUF348 domain-containing protein [Clostridiales bacterium]|jgi:uncharacterized protein YabE (DUF348 family)|nr:DUF348 domain-containing protein [Clostridiales bacterium]